MEGLDLEKIGIIGLLVALIGALIRGDLVPGRIYRDVLAQRDELLDRALAGTQLAERAASVVAKVTKR